MRPEADLGSKRFPRTKGILPSKRREAPFLPTPGQFRLGISFVISPGLQEKTDLVTLRPSSPVPPRQFFGI